METEYTRQQCKALGRVDGLFSLHSVKPWAFFQREQPRFSLISNLHVSWMLHGQAECGVRKEDESRRVFVPVLTGLSVLWFRHKVAVVSPGSVLWLCGCCWFTSFWHPCSTVETFAPATRLCSSTLFFFFNVALAPVKWLWSSLTLTFWTVSFSQWALVTARYFQVPTIFTGSNPCWLLGCFLPDFFFFFFTVFQKCCVNMEWTPEKH